MKKANAALRAELKAANIPFWRIAQKLGVHENTVIRRFRTELSGENLQAVKKAVAEIKAE